jgi:heat shock protein HtpX
MNTMKTWLLMGFLTAILIAAGNLFGGPSGALIALMIALAMNFAGYWFSDKIALSMSGAQPVPDGALPGLERMVGRLAERAGIPTPRLYVIPSPQPNAFATGRNPQNSAVAVTEGLLQMMDSEELEGVIAHELAHITNRDILIGSVAAAFAGAISMLANMAQWAAIFGTSSDDEEGGGGLLGSLALMIFGPIAATLVQLAISRSREYQADATAADLVGSPYGLIRALRKLELGTQAIPVAVSPATAHMYIAQPFAGGGIMSLFSTHPPMAERIRRLETLR